MKAESAQDQMVRQQVRTWDVLDRSAGDCLRQTFMRVSGNSTALMPDAAALAAQTDRIARTTRLANSQTSLK